MRTRTSTAPDDAKRVTMQVSTVGIVCNAALTVFKLVAGIVAHSSAIVADAVHSASDILGSLIVMIGAVFSHKAADASHPYGHEKLECIASILLGNILVLVGAAIGYAGVMKIVRGETLAAPGVLALIAAVVSIGVKEGLYWYTIAAAKRIRSVSLKAEAWHHRSDALSSIGSFAGVLGARLGVPILDPIASIVICLFIFKVAYGIFHESIDRLVDRACDPDTVAALTPEAGGLSVRSSVAVLEGLLAPLLSPWAGCGAALRLSGRPDALRLTPVQGAERSASSTSLVSTFSR